MAGVEVCVECWLNGADVSWCYVASWQPCVACGWLITRLIRIKIAIKMNDITWPGHSQATRPRLCLGNLHHTIPPPAFTAQTCLRTSDLFGNTQLSRLQLSRITLNASAYEMFSQTKPIYHKNNCSNRAISEHVCGLIRGVARPGGWAEIFMIYHLNHLVHDAIDNHPCQFMNP